MSAQREARSPLASDIRASGVSLVYRYGTLVNGTPL